MAKLIFSQSLYNYDKSKVNWLKAIFPIVIIVHHISNLGYTGIGFMRSIDAIIMPIFFAMSGFGLVIVVKIGTTILMDFSIDPLRSCSFHT